MENERTPTVFLGGVFLVKLFCFFLYKTSCYQRMLTEQTQGERNRERGVVHAFTEMKVCVHSIHGTHMLTQNFLLSLSGATNWVRNNCFRSPEEGSYNGWNWRILCSWIPPKDSFHVLNPPNTAKNRLIWRGNNQGHPCASWLEGTRNPMHTRLSRSFENWYKTIMAPVEPMYVHMR